MRWMVGCFLVLIPLIGWAQTLYVQSEKGALRQEPSFGAEKVARLARGTALQKQEKSGRWYRVKVEGQEGWVLRFLVGDNPPVDVEQTALGSDSRSIRKDARQRASGVTTAGAARGLRGEERRRRAGISGKANYADLERLMNLEVPGEPLPMAPEGEDR